VKFVFNYQKLLEHYRRLEEIAQRDYTDSLNILENEKSIYQGMWDLHDDAIRQSFELRQLPLGTPVEKLTQIQNFTEGQKIKIMRQREVVINHTTIVEQKQEILLAALKEKKTIEKLKENQLLEFKRNEAKRERKANDELVVMRFKKTADDRR
jgi:flagellar FliJ protein